MMDMSVMISERELLLPSWQRSSALSLLPYSPSSDSIVCRGRIIDIHSHLFVPASILRIPTNIISLVKRLGTSVMKRLQNGNSLEIHVTVDEHITSTTVTKEDMIFFRVSMVVSPGLESHPWKLSYTLDTEIWTPNEVVVDEKVSGGSLKIVAINHNDILSRTSPARYFLSRIVA